MLPMIIGLVGLPRAGKTTAGLHLQEAHGFSVFTNSWALTRVVEALGLTANRTNLSVVADALFDVLGRDIIAHGVVEKASNERTQIVVDGVRYPEEVETYRRKSDFKLVAVISAVDIRFQRAITTAHDTAKDAGVSIDDFANYADRQSESFVEEIMADADYIVTNEGSLEDLKASLDAIAISLREQNKSS